MATKSKKKPKITEKVGKTELPYQTLGTKCIHRWRF